MHNLPTETRKEHRLYSCTQYSEYGKDKCSIHYIKYETLYDIVLFRMKSLIAQAQADESMLLQRLLKSGDKQRIAEISKAKKDMAKAEKCLKELDNLFAKLYEDRACGNISERNYLTLATKYQNEQIKLETDITDFSDKLRETVQSKDNTERWISLLRQYTELTELTAPILNKLIEKNRGTRSHERQRRQENPKD